jgi:hypothetical protein
MKPYIDDVYADAPLPLHYFKQTEADMTDEVDEWEVEEIKEHRVDSDGKCWYLTKWAGFDALTWEPLNHFVHRYNVGWAEYCKKHAINVNVIDHLLGAAAQIRSLSDGTGRDAHREDGDRDKCSDRERDQGGASGPLPQTCGGRAGSSWDVNPTEMQRPRPGTSPTHSGRGAQPLGTQTPAGGDAARHGRRVRFSDS